MRCGVFATCPHVKQPLSPISRYAAPAVEYNSTSANVRRWAAAAVKYWTECECLRDHIKLAQSAVWELFHPPDARWLLLTMYGSWGCRWSILPFKTCIKIGWTSRIQMQSPSGTPHDHDWPHACVQKFAGKVPQVSSCC